MELIEFILGSLALSVSLALLVRFGEFILNFIGV